MGHHQHPLPKGHAREQLIERSGTFADRSFRRTLDGSVGEGLTCVAFSEDGARLATGHRDGSAAVWDAPRRARLAAFHGHAGAVSRIALTRDGTRVVTGGEDGAAVVWDAASGGRLRTLQGHGGAVLAVAVSPDGARVVAAGGRTLLWKIAATAEDLKDIEDRLSKPAAPASPGEDQTAEDAFRLPGNGRPR